MSFETLGLRPELLSAITEAGYTVPTPIQTKAIPLVLTGGDVVGIAQTGTGKTAAFVLPILEMLSHEPRAQRESIKALVIVPTRELAVQVEQNAVKYGKKLHLRCATIYGGVGETPQIQKLRSGVSIVIATPGRLLDLMRQGHVKFDALKIAVLDEADRMLDMGFLPDMRRIVNTLPKKRQTLLFSATFSSDIEKTAREFLTTPQTVEVSPRATAAETVTQTAWFVEKEEKLSLLERLLQDEALDSVLVFTRTKHGADKVARKLERAGVKTGTLHSNRSQNQRLEALRKFKAGEVRVLVATDIAARGIDVKGISHVINFDFPQVVDDYVHRIGRTGRALAVGDAISFVMADQRNLLRAVERAISAKVPVKEFVATGEEKLRIAENKAHTDSFQSENRPVRSSRPGGSYGRQGTSDRGSSRPRSSGTGSSSSSTSSSRSHSAPSSRPATRFVPRGETRGAVSTTRSSSSPAPRRGNR